MRRVFITLILSLSILTSVILFKDSPVVGRTDRVFIEDELKIEGDSSDSSGPDKISSPKESDLGEQIAQSALSQVGKTLSYDPSYVRLTYPNGDVSIRTGVCTDVVIRALRGIGLDLQQEIHEDMKKNFSQYPQNWGLSSPDKNIDHRRVPNQMKYFERKHISMKEKLNFPETYLAGDIIVWKLSNGLDHTGIISKKRHSSGVPLVIHNIGRGAVEEAAFYIGNIMGHYRIKVDP